VTEPGGRESRAGEPTKQNGDERRARSGRGPSSAAVPERDRAKRMNLCLEVTRAAPIKADTAIGSTWTGLARDKTREGEERNPLRLDRKLDPDGSNGILDDGWKATVCLR
jgi:hypothetical protein